MGEEKRANTEEIEIWRTVSEVPCYEISNLGRVRHIRHKKILTPWINVDGYAKVNLSQGNAFRRSVRSVHRLLAIEFLPNPKNKPQVNHIDNNRGNYSLSNLEWVTGKENMIHAFKRTARHVPERTTEVFEGYCVDVYLNDVFQASYNTRKEASDHCGVSLSTVSNYLSKKQKTEKGFSFRKGRHLKLGNPVFCYPCICFL